MDALPTRSEENKQEDIENAEELDDGSERSLPRFHRRTGNRRGTHSSQKGLESHTK